MNILDRQRVLESSLRLLNTEYDEETDEEARAMILAEIAVTESELASVNITLHRYGAPECDW